MPTASGWRSSRSDSSPSEAGGYDKVTVAIKGKGAYSRMKYEAGPASCPAGAQDRVARGGSTPPPRRLPSCPRSRRSTSTIDPNDLKVDVYRSTGPGGQSVNTTDSAVRLTHLPTGIVVVTVQDEKSQLQNKEKAMRILRARLYQLEQERQQAELAGARTVPGGRGGRSEKIRTYNFKENRVTDHRVGLTLKRLDQVLDGDLDEFVNALSADEQATRLAEGV